jgi:hypothetical protein
MEAIKELSSRVMVVTSVQEGGSRDTQFCEHSKTHQPIFFEGKKAVHTKS